MNGAALKLGVVEKNLNSLDFDVERKYTVLIAQQLVIHGVA